MEAITTWAQCDACTKWRRVTQSLADSLEDNDAWTCDQNPNPLFASCNVEQELSDNEIDRQLDSNDDEALMESEHRLRKKRPAVWQLVTENQYTHRARKAQDEDDIMICQCRMRTYGGKGCGPDCLNRLLNIECVPGYCPSCDECHNQMFSRRQYADIEKRRAGAKGFGLFANTDLPAGHFVIQYLGEVLEEEEYMRRKVHYQASGQRHYYFMNVGNGEVIDACRKGALGRFINHSCDPNCETQKWVVDGELAIGLFSTKAIPAGTELTFDYNFERYGDKPMRCLCGSTKCRGFVGGTQETTKSSNFEEVDDASEDPEPIMVTEAEADAALTAILDQNIGVGPNGWDANLQRRLAALAEQHGVPLWEDGSREDNGGSDAESHGRPEAVKMQLAEAVPRRKLVQMPAKKARAKTVGVSEKRVAAKSAAPGSRVEFAAPPRKRLKHIVDGDTSASTASTTTALLPFSGVVAEQSPAATDAGEALGVGEAKVDPGPPLPLPLMADEAGELAADPLNAITAPAENSAAAETAGDMHRPFLPSYGGESMATAATAAVESAPTSATTTPAPVARKPSRMVLSALSKELTRGSTPKGARKRSEIDRRLDSLVPSGKLRDAATATVVKVLRLFNLCDIGAAGQPSSTSRHPRSHFTSPSSGGPGGHRSSPRRSPDAGSGRSEGISRGSRHHRRPSSWDTEVQSARAERPDLTARQRARMADLSLLLDVICSTTSPTAKQELVRCGLLRQLHSTLGRNVAPTYQVVLRKMLRAVEGLPLTADDVHLTRSAHGSFGDILGLLALHSDPEVRAKSQGLLQRYPMWACTRPVVRGGSAGGSGAPSASHGGRFSSVSSSSTGVLWSGGPPATFRSRPPARMHPHAADHRTTARFGTPPSSRPREACAATPEHPSTPNGAQAAVHYQRSPSGLPPPYPEAGRQSPSSHGHSAASPRPQWLPLLPQLGGKVAGAASPPPAINGVNSTPHYASDKQDSAEDTRVGSSPLQPPLLLPPAWQHGAAGSLPPGIGATAGMVHVTMPPQAPPMASAADGLLHVAAGVPHGGFPPPDYLLLQMGKGSSAARLVPPDDTADVAALSDVSDGEVDNLSVQSRTFLVDSCRQEQHRQQKWQDDEPPWHQGSQTASEESPDFFAVDLRNAAGSSALEDMPQDWDSPHADFEAYVSEIVRVRLGRQLQAAPPHNIGLPDARFLYTKVSSEILEKEQQAYQERDKCGAHKLIDRRKLEPKIKEFIRDSVRRLHAAQQT